MLSKPSRLPPITGYEKKTLGLLATVTLLSPVEQLIDESPADKNALGMKRLSLMRIR